MPPKSITIEQYNEIIENPNCQFAKTIRKLLAHGEIIIVPKKGQTIKEIRGIGDSLLIYSNKRRIVIPKNPGIYLLDA